MNIMKSWEKLSQKLWDSFGSKLNPTAKKIKAWQLPPKISEQLEILANKMPVCITNLLLNFVTKIYKDAEKIGNKKFVNETLGNVRDFIEKIITK
ncbi:MAG: hypothetical protein KJ888_20675 [Gammaproteobacteria bacterium]|uniref:Uncharacterized protein n=1 Tax=viral metagenome TaxID=1070528 RepID=A0A6M3IFN3_9ZZZZ|nr:hypothetical protein [Gammaproteobacteria bacterium]